MDNTTPPPERDPFAPLSEEERASAAGAKGTERPTDEVWEPTIPAPEEPPEATYIRHWVHGPAVASWVYRNAAGAPLFVTARFNITKSDCTPGKKILPYVFGRRRWTVRNGPDKDLPRDLTGWHFKQPKPLMPLYGLDRLAARPGAPVLVCEGEKKADVVPRLLPDLVGVTSQGGSSSAKWSDWSPLAGRAVAIWPDNDVSGRKYAAEVARLAKADGAAAVHIVAVPSDWPDGWDLADPLPARVTPDTLTELLAAAPEFTEEAEAEDAWLNPDRSVLRLCLRPPPPFPLAVFGPWAGWIESAASAAAAPVDYVAATLLSSASALIGNARWAQATPGWQEPPHLWDALVGNSGDGKSPATDALLRAVLPPLENRMALDFPDRLREWTAANVADQAALKAWEGEVKKAVKDGHPAPEMPTAKAGPPPEKPRLRINDVTIERVASVLASAAPKGLLVIRDELAGWLMSLNNYNDAGRAFWIEAYGGRPYSVDRQKYKDLGPIEVARLVVAVVGGTQPDKLAEMMAEADDGLLARVQWFWPDPVAFHIAHTASDTDWAINALEKLRLLELTPGVPGRPPAPIMVPLVRPAVDMIEEFGRDMQAAQETAGGLMTSAYGKARGTALRLSLVLQYLWWAGTDGFDGPPSVISEKAFLAAAAIVSDYLMPMAERVYGDAGTSTLDRNTTTLARWIIKNKPTEIHVRHMQRVVRLPGLSDAEAIHDACMALVEAGWLRPPPRSTKDGRTKVAYAVNPNLWEKP